MHTDPNDPLPTPQLTNDNSLTGNEYLGIMKTSSKGTTPSPSLSAWAMIVSAYRMPDLLVAGRHVDMCGSP